MQNQIQSKHGLYVLTGNHYLKSIVVNCITVFTKKSLLHTDVVVYVRDTY